MQLLQGIMAHRSAMITALYEEPTDFLMRYMPRSLDNQIHET